MDTISVIASHFPLGIGRSDWRIRKVTAELGDEALVEGLCKNILGDNMPERFFAPNPAPILQHAGKQRLCHTPRTCSTTRSRSNHLYKIPRPGRPSNLYWALSPDRST